MYAHHAGRVGLHTYQFQIDPPGKHTLAPANGNGMNHEHIVVNQTEPHKCLRGADAAGYAQVFA